MVKSGGEDRAETIIDYYEGKALYVYFMPFMTTIQAK